MSEECDFFGDIGLHASTHVPIGATREHCDLCGRPVPDGSLGALDAINRSGVDFDLVVGSVRQHFAETGELHDR